MAARNVGWEIETCKQVNENVVEMVYLEISIRVTETGIWENVIFGDDCGEIFSHLRAYTSDAFAEMAIFCTGAIYEALPVADDTDLWFDALAMRSDRNGPSLEILYLRVTLR